MTAFFKKYVLLIMLLTGFFSCNSNEKEDAGRQTVTNAADSTETITSIAKEDSALLFNIHPGNDFDLHKTIPHFNWSKLELQDFWVEDSIPTETFHYSAKFAKEYAPVLRWSADSSYILDLGSLGTTILKDETGKRIASDGDIDNRVSLINVSQQQKKELLFFGSDTELITGGWLANEQLGVLASRMHQGKTIADTILWLIDVKEDFFRKYRVH